MTPNGKVFCFVFFLGSEPEYTALPCMLQCRLLVACLQLRGHSSLSELAEVEGSRRKLKVLLAEDNLINMKVNHSCFLHV